MRTDAASIWATGVTWWQVPPVAKVVLKGKLSPGVTGKDVIIALCGLFNKDEVLNHAVEVRRRRRRESSNVSAMTIANMTTEWGALAGVFPFDEVTVNYLRSRVPEFTNPNRPGTRGAKSRSGYTNADIDEWWKNRSELSADADAEYAIELELDLATVIPHVSGPNEVKTMVSLPEMERKHVPIQKAYLMSCVNARFEDLRDAAEVIRARGRTRRRRRRVLSRAGERRGAGAAPSPAAIGKRWSMPARFRCRPVAARASASVAVWCKKARSRSARPIAISKAAWAIATRWSISVRPPSSRRARWPDLFARHKVHRTPGRHGDSTRRKKTAGQRRRCEIIDGFPPSVRGRVLFIDKDNLNTDGIYASKHTYRDDMTPEQMAAVTFENYDPNFNTLYQKGDVVVGGLNFGTGSSREQAATALKFKGIPCVIAASFSETYKRNAFNNGFVVFECPELVTHLRDTLTDRAPTTLARRSRSTTPNQS